MIRSDIVSVQGYAVSMVGGRQENQDDWGYVDTPLGFFLVVCDGMGGGPGGKTASMHVKTEMARALCDSDTTTPCDVALRKAAGRAQEELERMMSTDPMLVGMGSTFVAVLINRQSAYVAHAGDSRCYQLRGKRCIYRSQDHSLVAELVKKKALTEEEARLSPQSNIISRGLGSISNHVPDIEKIAYKKGDRFVLCTDGIWGAMPNHTLISKLASKGQLSAIAGNISMEVDNIGIAKGGLHDNHTLAMIEINSDSVMKANIMSPKLLWSIAAGIIILAAIVTTVILLIKYYRDNQPGASAWNSKTTSSSTIVHYEQIQSSDIGTEITDENIRGGNSESENSTDDINDLNHNETERSLNPFDSVYIFLGEMLKVKETIQSTAVSQLDNNIKKIVEYLNTLANKDTTLKQDINNMLLNVIGEKKRADEYKNLNVVMKIMEGNTTFFVPTQKAKGEINSVLKRVEKVAERHHYSDK